MIAQAIQSVEVPPRRQEAVGPDPKRSAVVPWVEPAPGIPGTIRTAPPAPKPTVPTRIEAPIAHQCAGPGSIVATGSAYLSQTSTNGSNPNGRITRVHPATTDGTAKAINGQRINGPASTARAAASVRGVPEKIRNQTRNM